MYEFCLKRICAYIRPVIVHEYLCTCMPVFCLTRSFTFCLTISGLLSTDIISNMLLDRARINPNTKNNDGATPLHLAVKNSNSTLVKFIVRDERTSLNEEDGSGNTPQLLHWACAQQDKEAVQLLVRDERCDPNEKDSNGDTALHVACRLTLPGKSGRCMQFALEVFTWSV